MAVIEDGPRRREAVGHGSGDPPSENLNKFDCFLILEANLMRFPLA